MDLFYIGSNQRRLDSTCSFIGRRMKEQITSQQEEVRNLRKILEMIQESQVQREEITSQQKEIKQLSEIVEKIQVLYASAHSEDVY